MITMSSGPTQLHPALVSLGEVRDALPSTCSGLTFPTPCYAKTTRGSVLGNCQSWHSALVVPPLPGECVGRLQLLSCLARGKKRREMSRWIYLEPDLPPTASEGASGRAKSQARGREEGEGDLGIREGPGGSIRSADCPQSPAMCQSFPCNSSCLLTRDGKNLLGLCSPTERFVFKLTLAPRAIPAVPSTVRKRCPPEP